MLFIPRNLRAKLVAESLEQNYAVFWLSLHHGAALFSQSSTGWPAEEASHITLKVLPITSASIYFSRNYGMAPFQLFNKSLKIIS
jgi:hypothetical protein